MGDLKSDSAQKMLNRIKKIYHLNCPRVFKAMLKVPRETFVPPEQKSIAFADQPISIGFGQTISQPYTVAFMTHLLGLCHTKVESVLEIGTGSGYQAAILAHLAKKVYTIEIIPQLAKKARQTFQKLNLENIQVKIGSGETGWLQKAPFGAILVTAGMENVPRRLFEQLKENGILVAPIGVEDERVMTKFVRRKNRFIKKEYGIFHFVPFIEN